MFIVNYYIENDFFTFISKKNISIHSLRKKIIKLNNIKNYFLNLFYKDNLLNVIDLLYIYLNDLAENYIIELKIKLYNNEEKLYLQINHNYLFKKEIKNAEKWYKLDDRTIIKSKINYDIYGLEINTLFIDTPERLNKIIKFLNLNPFIYSNFINKKFDDLIFISKYDFILAELISGDLIVINNCLENINNKQPTQLPNEYKLGTIINNQIIQGNFEKNSCKYLICWDIETGNETYVKY